MEGFLNTWRENGVVPQWPHPNGGGMAGTMSDVTFSEGVVKLPHCGTSRAAAAGYCVNASALYAASRENAFGRNAEYYAHGYMYVLIVCGYDSVYNQRGDMITQAP